MTKRTSTQKSPAGLFKFLILVFLFAALIILLTPKAVQSHIKNRLAESLGLPLAIGEIDFSFTSPQFLLKDLLLSNPDGFPSAKMAEIGRVNVQYAPSFVFLQGLDVKKVEVDFKELRLVRNEAGEINLPIQTPLQAAGDEIDEVVLNLGAVTYTDLSGKEPVQKNFDLELVNAVYRNVKGVAGIMEIVGWEVRKRTGVPEMEKEIQASPQEEAKPSEVPGEPAPASPAPVASPSAEETKEAQPSTPQA